MLSVSIIIPMHNEEGNAIQTVREVFKVFKSYKMRGNVIIVDDRSTDGTPAILDKLAKKIDC